MKSIYIADLQKNQVITNETFAIYDSKKAQDKNGKFYYDLEIGDKTGKIKAKIWSDNIKNCDLKAIIAGRVVQLSGKVDEFKGVFQLNILQLNAVDESSLDEFLETSDYNPDDMMSDLEKTIKAIKDKAIRQVLENYFADQDVYRRFKYWPAADTVHHDFRSGLLQHVLEMLEISKSMKKFYPQANYDILTAGIILHDIGKLYELDASGISTSYSKVGVLVGHIAVGLRMLDQYGKAILDEDTYLHLSHLILAHHGMREYGSPVVPSTLEAIMLYYIDNLSAKSRTAVKAINHISDGQEFGGYNNWLNGARFWRGPEKEGSEDVEQLGLDNNE